MLENQTLFVGDEQMKNIVNSNKLRERPNSDNELKRFKEFEILSMKNGKRDSYSLHNKRISKDCNSHNLQSVRALSEK